MRFLVVLIFGIFSFLSVVAQVQSSAFNLTLKTLLAHSVPEVAVTKAVKMEDVLFLDAREWNEFNVSHINNAKYVGYDNFEIEKLNQIRKDQKLIVYCSVGYRSEKVAEKLRQAGFVNVSNLYGGIFEWVNQGNPVVDVNSMLTDKVHAYSKSWGIWLDKGTKVYDN